MQGSFLGPHCQLTLDINGCYFEYSEAALDLYVRKSMVLAGTHQVYDDSGKFCQIFVLCKT